MIRGGNLYEETSIIDIAGTYDDGIYACGFGGSRRRGIGLYVYLRQHISKYMEPDRLAEQQ
jgi:hypothetical protein